MGTGQVMMTGADHYELRDMVSADWTDASEMHFETTPDRVETDTGGDSAIKTAITFPRDFQFQSTVNGSVSSGQGGLGVFDVAEDGTFSDTNNTGNILTMTNSWSMILSGGKWHAYYGNSSKLSTADAVDGDVILFERVGEVFSASINDVLYHTWAETSPLEVRACAGRFTVGDDFSDLSVAIQ